MNSNPHNPMAGGAQGNSGEETLRLIARLPAPEGLEERVHKALDSAPRNGRVLTWPARMGSPLKSQWMRGAAAAAIVFVVVGGGWGVYSRVEPGPAGKVVVMPARVPVSGGFAGAGAMRTPETLPGPKLRDQGTKGPSEQAAPTGSEGTREQGSRFTKKPAVPKKRGVLPAGQAEPQAVAP